MNIYWNQRHWVMKIVHHKENRMVEVLQKSLNVAQILSWQLKNTNLQWSRFPTGIICCKVTKLIATSSEFGWGFCSSCHTCQSALRCILRGVQVWTLSSLQCCCFQCSPLGFALNYNGLNSAQSQLQHSLGFVFKSLSVKRNPSLLSTWVKTPVWIYLKSQSVLVQDLVLFHSSFIIGFVCFRTDFSFHGIRHSFCSTWD